MAALDPEELAEGRLVAERYRIERVLGRGGMGVVCACVDEEGGERVAVKILSKRRGPGTRAYRRFVREAKIARGIDHPGVVKVHHLGFLESSQPYMVMELLEGRTLRALMEPVPWLDAAVARAVLASTLDALAAVHACRVVHRDLKPENIFVLDLEPPRATIKLLDFGVSRSADDPAARVTVEGHAVGTPMYMSPEQLMAAPPDARADIYSLGVTYYEMLTGELPYTCDDPADLQEMLEAILGSRLVPPSERRPSLGTGHDAVVAHALAQLPAKRYRTAGAMRADLLAVADAPRGSARG